MKDKIRVLMVDDEAAFRETTRKILGRRGFETIMAADGQEALDRLDTRPDVVVLDIRMPGEDGLTVLKKINALRPELPVIMLTGHGSQPSAEEARHLGAFDYLSKPCDIDVLAARIEEAFRGEGDAADREKTVGQRMIPIKDYTTLSAEVTVGEAVAALKASFKTTVTTGKLMETGHRSVLVIDGQGRPRGMLGLFDLMSALMPAYLNAPRPAMADSIQYSPMFWHGMFSREVDRLADRPIEEIMSPAPPVIDVEASLMEAAYLMVSLKARRLVVFEGGTVAGVIREQDLFFEMERLLAAHPA